MILKNYKKAIAEAEEYLNRKLTWKECSDIHLGLTTKEKLKELDTEKEKD